MYPVKKVYSQKNSKSNIQMVLKMIDENVALQKPTSSFPQNST